MLLMFTLTYRRELTDRPRFANQHGQTRHTTLPTTIILPTFQNHFLSADSRSPKRVPAGSPSRGGDVTIYGLDINQPSLPTLFILFLSVSVFMALSTVFHSINPPDDSPLSRSVLPVLFLPYWSFQLYLSLYESLPQP